MRNSILILIYFSLLNFSCYTAGYTTISSIKIPSVSPAKIDSVIILMEKFKEEHPELMVDSNVVNTYLNKTNYYYDLIETEQIYSNKRLYPLYPIYNWDGLYSWYLFSPDKTSIYKIGLYANGFAISSILIFQDGKYKNHSKLNQHEKDIKRVEIAYVKKFNNELLPLLRTYFDM